MGLPFYVVIRATQRSTRLQVKGITWVLVRSRKSNPRPPSSFAVKRSTDYANPAGKLLKTNCSKHYKKVHKTQQIQKETWTEKLE